MGARLQTGQKFSIHMFCSTSVLSNLQSLQLCMQALGPYGELHLNQKGQLNEIYKGLGAARCASEHT